MKQYKRDIDAHARNVREIWVCFGIGFSVVVFCISMGYITGKLIGI